MSNIPVPEDAILSTIGALVVGAFGWLLRLERRPKGMTFEDHSAICDASRAEIKDDLKTIMSKLDSQDEKSASFRDRTNDDITAIKVQVAKMTAPRRRK